MHVSPAARGCVTGGGGVILRGRANGINDCSGAIIGISQLAHGVITRGGDSKGFENKGGDTGDMGGGNKGCGNMWEVSVRNQLAFPVPHNAGDSKTYASTQQQAVSHRETFFASGKKTVGHVNLAGGRKDN